MSLNIEARIELSLSVKERRRNTNDPGDLQHKAGGIDCRWVITKARNNRKGSKSMSSNKTHGKTAAPVSPHGRGFFDDYLRIFSHPGLSMSLTVPEVISSFPF
jgi:hypothetical protein